MIGQLADGLSSGSLPLFPAVTNRSSTIRHHLSAASFHLSDRHDEEVWV